MCSARPGSVAATAAATPISACAFADSSVMELAMRSARPGPVAATAAATPISACAFADSSVMELAMRSASPRSRATRAGSFDPVLEPSFASASPTGASPGGRILLAPPITAADAAASTRSIAATSRPASSRKLSCRTRSALRRARRARLSGRSAWPGMTAPSTKTGITRTPRARAAPISSRTRLSGSSRRRPLRSSAADSQCGPITATSTAHASTAREIASAKSAPSSILSTSMKTCSAPKRSIR